MKEPRAPLLIISTVIKTVTISLSSQNSLTVGAFNFVKISSSLALELLAVSAAPLKVFVLKIFYSSKLLIIRHHFSI